MIESFLLLVALVSSAGAETSRTVTPNATQLNDYSFSIEEEFGIGIYLFGLPLDTELRFSTDTEHVSADESERIPNNRLNTLFESKYFAVGSTTCYERSYFEIGYFSFLGTPSIHYLTAISIALPMIDHDYYEFGSAELRLARRTGSATINAYSVSGISYANINGTATYSTSYISCASCSSGYTSLDISSAYSQGYLSGAMSIIILLDVSNTSSYVSCYSQTSAQSPAYLVSHLTNWGAAPVYDPLDENYQNCLAYALQIPGTPGLDIADELNAYFGNGLYMGVSGLATNFANDVLIDYLENVYQPQNTITYSINSARVLSSRTAQISSSERRIAFRIAFLPTGIKWEYGHDYHFMHECQGGGWAQKLGVNGNFGLESNPSYPDSQSNWAPKYCTETVYIAIEPVVEVNS